MTLNRRRLLAGAAMLMLWPGSVRAAPPTQSEAMLDLLPDRAGAARLGAQWVAQEHTEPREILESLQRRLRWSADADTDTLRHNLANAIAEDFHSGTVVAVQGWQIARTQAELCALAYFAAAGRV
ncbi:hypothetical protein [Dongia sedimenti]|uniref:Lytic murein transglycosylase n=1 Tax=Dongia sedimenti TaxID=3064282 RepID=A0ABU0YME4_9PROT|nr:hypothetical protein [Rhodospirillaceae bacterium R-7]